MIEALIACAFVLVPLFLAIPIIAKYQDIKAYTVQAARYAAWERTVWFGGDAAASSGISSSSTLSNKWDANAKTDNQIRAEIGARLLSDNVTKFSAADMATSGFSGGAKQLWRDRRGTGLLQNYSSIGTNVTNNSAPGLINTLLSPMINISSTFSNFTVDTKANYAATVGLSVQQVAFNADRPNNGLGACTTCSTQDFLATGSLHTFSAKNVIVANGWSANGPGSQTDYEKDDSKITTYNQVRGLTFTSLFKPPSGGGVVASGFKGLMDVLDAIALVIFPELSTLELGRIEVDRVPPDRVP